MLHSPVAAEIYKYLDANGTLRFTDDITQVPEAQREKMDTYEETSGSPIDSAALEKRKAAFDRIIDESQAAEKAAATEVLKSRAAEIKKRKAALEAQAQGYKAELEKLGGPPSRSASNRRLRIYNSKVRELNQKSGTHQQDLEELQADLNQLTEDAGDQAADLGLED